MPKFLSYDPPANEVRDIEVLTSDDAVYFTIRARKMPDKIVIEEISDQNGRLATASDLIKESRLTVRQVQDLVVNAFEVRR